ncbi:MAG: hypothetical protein GXP16_15950 [Gammaproteobacteria bacterium]|nr:hypothetical protein [Gammaproteobacteria bacterium]
MKYCWAIILVAFVSPVVADTPGSGSQFIQAAGADLVQGHCTACHSALIVTSQRGDAAFWLNTIRWMQKTQNLWAIPAQQEQQIVAYLAKHYAEQEWGRRPQLSPLLLP